MKVSKTDPNNNKPPPNFESKSSSNIFKSTDVCGLQSLCKLVRHGLPQSCVKLFKEIASRPFAIHTKDKNIEN